MIQAALLAYKAMSNTKKYLLTIALPVVLLLCFYGLSNLWLYFHDNNVISQHDNEVNNQVTEQVHNDEINIQRLNHSIDTSGSTLLDSVLSSQPEDADSAEQNGSSKLHQTVSDADAEKKELRGSEGNSGLGLENQLRTPPLSPNEITQLLQDEAKKGKEFCYPEEVSNDDGSVGIIEVCEPLSSMLNKPPD